MSVTLPVAGSYLWVALLFSAWSAYHRAMEQINKISALYERAKVRKLASGSHSARGVFQ